MLKYISSDGTVIIAGEDSKENHILTQMSSPNYWWMHVSEDSGSHVVIHHDGDVLPKEVKLDAMAIAVHHSKVRDVKMCRVHMVRVGDVKCMRQSGKVEISGVPIEMTFFCRREVDRCKKILSTRQKIKLI